MGRHTKLMEDFMGADAPVEQPQKTRGARWIGRVPLLPVLALVVAIALVGYAWTTKQISLNFAGAAPPQAGNCETAPCAASAEQGRATARAGRGTGRQTTVAVSVRVTGRTASGFTGTATLLNRGAKPVKGWTLALRFANAKVIGASGAVLLRPIGPVATLRATSVIAPGQAVHLVLTASGRFSTPTSCRLSGALCRVA
ncbi:cellulose binding domain-containing protein [Actinomadura scrupuli]|uniref:cellulose binding domain-containing protein n=1 Tax=Actinomadura scrupuli TaxID=559629 RepID=UPI003D988631